MTHYRNSGFTIIETTLVLAVTGLLLAVVLTGIGSSLNHERYTDAVNQSLDFFRGQYAETANISNDRPSTQSCDSSGISPSGGTIRGASDCLLLGSVIRSSDGKTITVNQVIARHDPSNDSGILTKTDAQILTASSLQQGDQTGSYSVEWGSTLLTPGTLNPASLSILVVRVPVTGTIETYASSSSTINVGSLATIPQVETMFCLDQRGFLGVSVKPMGIVIDKGASNTSGVRPIVSGGCT